MSFGSDGEYYGREIGAHMFLIAIRRLEIHVHLRNPLFPAKLGNIREKLVGEKRLYRLVIGALRIGRECFF